MLLRRNIKYKFFHKFFSQNNKTIIVLKTKFELHRAFDINTQNFF